MRPRTDHLEFSGFVDQHRQSVLRFLDEHAPLLVEQGSVQISWRYRNGRRLGPFYRLAYRKAGTQCSLYLGRDDALAAEVKSYLDLLRRARREWETLSRLEARARVAFRRHKHDLDSELRRYGLYRKGNEIRGWRSQPQARSSSSVKEALDDFPG